MSAAAQTRIPDALIAQARSADILAEAQRRKALLRRSGAEWVGPCPACGGHDRFSINTQKRVFNCRKSGRAGDVIELVMYLDALSFDEAVQALAGAEIAPRRARAMHRASEDGTNRYREKERGKAYGIWRAGKPLAGTLGDKYLLGRGVAIPRGAPLRFAPEQPYWHPDGNGRPSEIYKGPALLAAMTDETGRFQGVHITWLDPHRPGEKAELADPDTGEVLPAKKMRGSKRRAAIRLWHPDGASRLVMGEGIETVLSVYWAEAARLRDRTAYWSALDLGHMAGAAAKTVKHPTLTRLDKNRRARPVRVPGPVPKPQPDRDLQVGGEITEITLLGDGDSDAFTTRLAITRAAARLKRENRTVRAVFAPEGQDFNDMLRGGGNDARGSQPDADAHGADPP